ncbi:MAG: ATP-binding protein [Bacillota bacterium]|nr:ATP-binding protein [Bacillota bacterium]
MKKVVVSEQKICKGDRCFKVKNLQDSKRKYKKIFDESIYGLILWDDEQQITEINASAEKLLGLSEREWIGTSINEIFENDTDMKEKWTKHVGLTIKNGKNDSVFSCEYSDGTSKHIEFSSQHWLIEKLNRTMIKDVTEKVELEERLRKSDTLNIIGELAAGIAHEIRNPMTALKGFIQMLEASIKKENEIYYEIITSELMRIDSIINEFLILAKPQVIKFREADINQIIRETVDLLNAQAILNNVQFQIHYDQNIPMVYCEPNQLKKVFINMVKNAIEVMPDGGNITIQTSCMDAMIHISIQDEGGGIPEDKLKKIGVPFYTTKERGTGLGLMVSFKIIEEHMGTVKIDSKEGEGTTFYITLPINFQKMN